MEKLFNVEVVNKSTDDVETVAKGVSENKADKIERGLLMQIDVENYRIDVKEIK